MSANDSKISLEQSLQAYRVMNTPTKFSWKQHWAQESFSSPELSQCSESERKQFAKRLQECHVLLCDGITSREGVVCTLEDMVNIIVDKNNKNIPKTRRKVVYSVSEPQRPTGNNAFITWNGFQVIDLDIKNEELAKKLKRVIFDSLYKCNWFLGVVTSSSGMGLHVYTRIAIPKSDEDVSKKKKLLYYTNFRHKYSFVYLACLHKMEEYGYSKDDVIRWLDISMNKPQQGAFLGYDPKPLINTGFFEDFIYVNFDNVEDIGHPDVDWVAYPDLKQIFKMREWFVDDEDTNIDIEVLESPELEFDMHNKIHYKHNERWRLANTLVLLYGPEQGYKYLRSICANSIKSKELSADCKTAARHKKPVDPWAVNRLNNIHGFKIKLNIQDTSFDETEIFTAMGTVNNPNIIKESPYTHTINITQDQYLGSVRWQILDNIGRLTLLEAGAGLGKTEMVKQLAREGKKVMMVMPFTSTIKSKVENDKDWYYSYGSRKPRLDVPRGLALTIDKFSHLNLMDVKTSGFDYIFIDESHLMFLSEYRPVMAKVVEMIRNTEIPIIMMSGTPSGETVFFPDLVHIKVIKDDDRVKKFSVNLVDNTSHLMYQMCKQMASDIVKGRRILFPTNNGTLYSKQIHAAVTYFLQNDHAVFEPVSLHYYKKSNVGEKFMDDVNFEKTIKDTQILLCTTYLSVGVDILDKYNFSIYFADLMLGQDVEQFANRLRNNDLYINLFVAKNDAEGNSRSLHKYKELNFKMNDEEVKNVHSILRLCNAMLERNPIEYRYNSLVSSIIYDNKFVEYNEVENKYYLNEIAYKLTYFERKYREYAQQLPVLMKSMQAYGYEVSAMDLKEFKLEGAEIFRDLKSMVKLAYDDQLQLNTTHIEELIDIITDDRLIQYKDMLAGKYDIRKGPEWKNDITNKTMYVKNIEVFEKVIPIYVSLSKQYNTDTIKEIFEYCRQKGGSFNFAAIRRIRTLVNILYNDKNQRLDLPIKDFMNEVYEFSDLKKVHKKEIDQFINAFALKYMMMESTNAVIIDRSLLTNTMVKKKFKDIFNCLIKVSRPNKNGMVEMDRIELIWKEKEHYNSADHNDKLYILQDFLDILPPNIENIEDTGK